MRPILLVVAIAAAGGVARAESVPAPQPLPTGLAVGAELGEPSSITVRLAPGDGRLGIVAAVGTGTLSGLGLSMRAEVTRVVTTLARRPTVIAPLALGVGVRHHRHHYTPASMDELPDAHTGVIATATLTIAFGRLELYAEGAPGYDLWRTASCTFASGASSVCPHAQSTRLFLEAFAGARWHLR